MVLAAKSPPLKLLLPLPLPVRWIWRVLAVVGAQGRLVRRVPVAGAPTRLVRKALVAGTRRLVSP
jgi:hypothetical protein